MQDQQIVELFWRRSEEAIRATADKYGPYCRTVAKSLLADPRDAEECVNDTWIGAWNAIPPHRPSRLRLFLGKITRRTACDRLRASGAQKRGGGQTQLALNELEECLPAASCPERETEARDLAESLNRFLEALPREKRVIFVQRYWYLCSVEKLAAMHGMGKNTAASILFRLRSQLREHLKKEGFAV